VPSKLSSLVDVESVGAGLYFSLALKSDGTVMAWGRNNSYQLGIGSDVDRDLPVVVSNLNGFITASSTIAHALAVKRDGSVWSWGNNGNGQLGDGTTQGRTSPVRVSGISTPMGYKVVSVAAGGAHSMALNELGDLWAWGSNQDGQLGDGTFTSVSVPKKIFSNAAVAVAAGNGHSMMLGGLFTIDVNTVGQGAYGQLGTGSSASTTWGTVGIVSNVTAIAAGANHSLALQSDGTVWAWGANDKGQLGDATTTQRGAPVQVYNLTNITTIVAGGGHNLALKSDGTVWAWGANDFGQLGDGTTTNRTAAIAISGLTGIVSIGAGAFHSYAIKGDGTVYAWGDNGYGQFGDGTTTGSHTPMVVANLADSAAIIGMWGGGMSIGNDGSLRAWGYNVQGALGSGSQIDHYVPQPVDDLFPSGGAMPAGWAATSGSSANWAAVMNSYAGLFGLQSGAVGNAANSGVQVSGNFRDGYLSFERKVSSEA
jgi:alpha-tubulin suppressor-like RCC1 family protein